MFKKVLVLSAASGAGHIRAAQAIERAIKEMAAAQAGQSDDPKTAAVLRFVLKVVKDRAQVSESDINELRAVGFYDEHIVEILAHVALNLFTNYVNVALNVPVDFPKVRLLKA